MLKSNPGKRKLKYPNDVMGMGREGCFSSPRKGEVKKFD